MKILKNFVILFFSIMLLISTPLSVFATNVNIGGNTGGGANSNQAGGGGGNASPFTTSNEKQGYRFTFINNDSGERMSKTIDILRSDPITVNKAFTGSLIDGPEKENKENFGYYIYTSIESQIKDVVINYKTIPWWYSEGNGYYNGNSDEFADWLLSKEALKNLSGNYAPIVDLLYKTDYFYTGVFELNEKESLQYIDSSKKLLKSVDEYLSSSDIEQQYYGYKYFRAWEYTFNDWIIRDTKSTYTIEYILNVWSVDLSEMYKNVSEKLGSPQRFESIDKKRRDDIDDEIVENNKSSYTQFKLGDRDTLEVNDIVKNAKDYVQSGINTGMNLVQNVNNGEAKSSINSLFVDGKYDANMYGYIPALINVLGADGYSIFNLDSDKSMTSKDAMNKLGNAFLQNECSLIVEPIFWCSPRNYTTGRNWTEEIYGTPRNWSSYMINYVQHVWPQGTGFSDYGLDNYKAINVAFFGAMELDENEFNLVDSQDRKPFYNGNHYLKAQAPKVKDDRISFSVMNQYANIMKNIGVGMHIYAANGQPNGYKTGTPEPGIPPSIEDGESKIRVIKYYRTSFGNGITYPYSYYTISNAPRTLTISDEKEYGWTLIGYFTSINDYVLPDNGSIFKYTWDKAIEDNPKGTYIGYEPGKVTIKDSDPDKTLLILYERSDINNDVEQEMKVIKVYEDENGNTDKVSDPEIITGTSYEVPIEDDYIYTENKKSPNPSKDVSGWGETEGNPGTETTITIDDTTKTIYILYRKNKNSQIKLYSNELSYTYGLKDIAGITENRVLFSIYDTIPKSPGTYPSCNGHGRYDRACTRYSHQLSDSSWTIKVSNNYDYNNESNYLRDYTNLSGLGGTWSVGTYNVNGVSISSTSSKVARPDGDFLLYRDKESDLVTLYPNKNNSLSTELAKIGLTSDTVSYTPQGNRMSKELINDKQFLRPFITGFTYIEHENVLGWKWLRSKCNKNNKGNFLTETVTSPADANVYYSKDNVIKQYYLLGQNNVGNEEVSDVRSDDFGKRYSYNKSYISTSADLKFYPYSLMLYRAKNDNSNPKEVYVTSENLSTMKVYNAVQLGVYKKKPINVLLDSTQWSTHARSLAFEANTDKKSVLPGGAVLDLSMGSKGDTQLGIRLWQSCLRDEQVQTVQPDSFNTSLSKAKEIATTYQNEVKSVLEGYGLVQWGTEGVSTDLNSVLSSGVELHNNTSLDWDGRSYSTSNDSKYYLKHNGSGSDRANFDVLDSKIVKQTFYEISSDVNGTITLTKDGSYLVSSKLGESIDTILSNPEAKLLDDNTKLVTNYFSAIDRNLGDTNKYDRENLRKYNEAYDGVGVLLTDLSFDIGFGSNSGHRTTVLDTLLTSTSNSKSDLYNFSDDKVRSFVFATSQFSTGSTEAESQGYIGTLSSDSTMGELYTVLSDIQSLVYSKNFYSSNFNVTDLN